VVRKQKAGDPLRLKAWSGPCALAISSTVEIEARPSAVPRGTVKRCENSISEIPVAAPISKEKDEARFLNNAGLLSMRRGDLDSAETKFRNALELAPDYVLAHFNLGLVLAAKGDLNAAITEFRTTLADQPANPKVHLNLGRVLLLSGNTEAAIAEFEMAMKLQPGYPEAKMALQEVVEKQKALGRR